MQAASHPFITGQPHPRDLGALTIADDPLISDRYTRQMQAMQLQYQKDQQEAERKRALRIRQQVRMLSLNEIDCASLTAAVEPYLACPKAKLMLVVHLCIVLRKGYPRCWLLLFLVNVVDFVVVFRHGLLHCAPGL